MPAIFQPIDWKLMRLLHFFCTSQNNLISEAFLSLDDIWVISCFWLAPPGILYTLALVICCCLKLWHYKSKSSFGLINMAHDFSTITYYDTLTELNVTFSSYPQCVRSCYPLASTGPVLLWGWGRARCPEWPSCTSTKVVRAWAASIHTHACQVPAYPQSNQRTLSW